MKFVSSPSSADAVGVQSGSSPLDKEDTISACRNVLVKQQKG